MARTLSLTVPSGHLTLGNLLGAIRQWAGDQRGPGSLKRFLRHKHSI